MAGQKIAAIELNRLLEFASRMGVLQRDSVTIHRSNPNTDRLVAPALDYLRSQ